jgi:putative transposase
MRDLIILFVHIIVTIFRLWRPGGARSVIAESILFKQQLLILNRSRKRAPNLRVYDRFIAGACSMFVKPSRLIRSAIVSKPSTLLSIHQALINTKYRILFSQKQRRKPGPKGPSKELIDAIVDTKPRNPAWGCPRIAQQIALVFGISLDKDVVRRILARHYQSDPDSCGPSWLTFLGHMRNSLWSLDLFPSSVSHPTGQLRVETNPRFASHSGFCVSAESSRFTGLVFKNKGALLARCCL